MTRPIEKIKAILAAKSRSPQGDIAAGRAEMEINLAKLPVREDVHLSEIMLGGHPALECVPGKGGRSVGEGAGEKARKAGTILYFHGGGYVFGSSATHRSLTAELAARSGARVVSLDYPLAPEALCPAPVDAGEAAWDALCAEGAQPATMTIAGDSAGGGAALALTMRLTERGGGKPAAAMLFSPWLDLVRDKVASEDAVVTEDRLHAYARHYVGLGGDARSADASPLFRSLAGSPPLLIHVSAEEGLLSDSTRLRDKAEAAGVSVSYRAWAEMVHVWHMYAHMLEEAVEALDDAAAFHCRAVGAA